MPFSLRALLLAPVAIAASAFGGARPVAATAATTAPGPVKDDSTLRVRHAAPPAGYYQCTFWRSVWSAVRGQRTEQLLSSMRGLRLGRDGTYETEYNPVADSARALEDRVGRFSVDPQSGAFTFQGGWLTGKTATFRPDTAPPTIVFPRKPNEVRGRPQIDLNDTACSFRGPAAPTRPTSAGE